MIRYLGFDDPDYIDRLTAGFEWDRDGPSVLAELLAGRDRTGAPLREWATP